MPPRLLEHARPIDDCPGERSTRMTEELRLDEIVGERGAVERAERSLAARTGAMNRPRDQLLAAAALAFDQDRRGRGGALGGLSSSAIAGVNPRSSLSAGTATRSRRVMAAESSGATAAAVIVRTAAARVRS